MAVKFIQANGKYGIGDIAVFTPALEAQLIKQRFAREYKEEDAVADKKKDETPQETKKPDGPQTRQTTVGPQKR